MASPSYLLSSHGSNQHYQQKVLHTKNKAGQKTAATQPPQTQSSASGASSADADEEADETDSSANEAQDETDHKSNAIALSGAQASITSNDQRLAGLQLGDMHAGDVTPAVSGAAAKDDDDEYAGVDEVSDDDEVQGMDERSIERAAEKDLIDEFEREQQPLHETTFADLLSDMALPDLSPPANTLIDLDMEIDMNNDPFAGLQFGDGLYQELYQDAEDSIWMQTAQERIRGDSEDSNGSTKRVRFAEQHEMMSRSSSMSSSDDPTELFPDLLDAQDDPALRHRFGLDVDVDAAFEADRDETGSFYDFDGEEERMAMAIDDESDSDAHMSSSDSDSYDEGETTEEDDDDVPPAKLRPASKVASFPNKSLPTTPSNSKRGSVSTPRSSVSAGTPTPGRPPKMAKFVIDKTKLAVSADTSGSGKAFTIVPPTNPTPETKAFWDHAKEVLARRNGHVRSSSYQTMRTPATQNLKPRPLTAQSTLGTMFDGNLGVFNDPTSDLTLRAFPELLRLRTWTPIVVPRDDDSDGGSSDLNINDFVDLDDSESDTMDAEPESASSIMSPTSELIDSVSSVDAPRHDSLLDHLDAQRGLVGAFRHNQTYAKTMSSMASHPAERASTSEANALQKGRRAAGNTPMTPARKKRVSQDMSLTGAGIRKVASSPLAAKRPRSRGSSTANLNQTLGRSYF